MSYVRYSPSMVGAGLKKGYAPSPAQSQARAVFAQRSKEVSALVHAGHTKAEAWAKVVPHAKPRVSHKKRVAEGKGEGGAVLGGRVAHHRRRHILA